jgi:hypothetical protein
MAAGPLGWGALAALLVVGVGASVLRGRIRVVVAGVGAASFVVLTALLLTEAVDGRAPIAASTDTRPAPGAEPTPEVPAPTQVTDAARALGLVDIAARAAAAGRLDDARRALGEADALFQRANDVRGRAAVALNRARLEESLGQPDAARTAYAGARDLYRRAGDAAGEAITWAAMGDLEKGTTRYGAARTAFREARAAYARAGGFVATEHVLLGIEEEALAPNGVERARHRLTEARALYDLIADPAGAAQVAVILGQLDEGLGNHLPALAAYHDGADLYRAADNPAGFTEASTRAGLLEATYGYLDGARATLTGALVTAANYDDRPGMALASLVLGRVERLVGDYTASQAAFLVADEMAAAMGDDFLRAEAILGAADADRLAGRLAEAKDGYQRSIAGFALADPAATGPAMFGFAMTQAALGDAATAFNAFGAAATLFSAAGDDRGEALTQIHLGIARLGAGKPAEALEAFRAAFDPLIRFDSALGEAYAQVGVARAKRALGDVEGVANGRGYAQDAMAAARDPLLEANRLLGLGLFGTPRFLDADPARAEAFTRAFPDANREAQDLVRWLHDAIAALAQ